MHIGTEQIHVSQHKYLIPRKPLEKAPGHKIINDSSNKVRQSSRMQDFKLQ